MVEERWTVLAEHQVGGGVKRACTKNEALPATSPPLISALRFLISVTINIHPHHRRANVHVTGAPPVIHQPQVIMCRPMLALAGAEPVPKRTLFHTHT